MTGKIAPIADSLQTELARALQRQAKALGVLTAPEPMLGPTPRDLVVQRGTLALYHYRPCADEIYRVPLLIVAALTNRGSVFDLAPGHSFVQHLLERGYDVYMVDWNAPRPDEQRLRLEDYVFDFLPEALRRVQEISGEAEVNVLGYCMGGLLVTLHAALHPDGPMKQLALIATPVDFHEMTLFRHWTDARHFDLDRLVDTTGNVPPEVIYGAFDLLRPATGPAAKLQLWDKLWDDAFVEGHRRLDRWSRDVLPLPGALFRQLVQDLFRENRLACGELLVGGRRVDLRAIQRPVLHALAAHDHIVPHGASQPLVAAIGSRRKQEIVLKGGHASLVAGGNAVKRLWPALDAWLAKGST
ncbi:MAG: alpha/beta fold hydrolase [Burkholderiales bacterium]|jgi:polyhydroxyalkanoate synthase|uniref:alpha/beta fold hydrolase n=1 Tax=Roseateles sp. TaxID=1971397 RepID=UPI000FAEDF93|nr:MAG: alpha/beta fold hydrolase [Burkholderiales bacterium]